MRYSAVPGSALVKSLVVPGAPFSKSLGVSETKEVAKKLEFARHHHQAEEAVLATYSDNIPL